MEARAVADASDVRRCRTCEVRLRASIRSFTEAVDSRQHVTQNASVSLKPIRLVLDTNIVLDCLVFRDPTTRDLLAALEARRVHALVSAETLGELERVLAYPQCRLAADEPRQVLDRYLEVATMASMPEGFNRDELLLPPGFPRCRDGDDEIFLALAYHARADALISKDKAVLKLRRKARRFGVEILTPADLPSLGL